MSCLSDAAPALRSATLENNLPRQRYRACQGPNSVAGATAPGTAPGRCPNLARPPRLLPGSTWGRWAMGSQEAGRAAVRNAHVPVDTQVPGNGQQFRSPGPTRTVTMGGRSRKTDGAERCSYGRAVAVR